MRLILTKTIRKYKKEQLPYTCYAFQHLPDSLNKTCDCKTFCKFPPRGNSSIGNHSQKLFPEPLVIPHYIACLQNKKYNRPSITSKIISDN